jgi:hypothetical protein
MFKNSDPKLGPIHGPKRLCDLEDNERERVAEALRRARSACARDPDEYVPDAMYGDVDDSDQNSGEEESDSSGAGSNWDPIERAARAMDDDLSSSDEESNGGAQKKRATPSRFNPRYGVVFDDDDSKKKKNRFEIRRRRAANRQRRREEMEKMRRMSLGEKKKHAVEERGKQLDDMPIRRRSLKSKKPRLWTKGVLEEASSVYGKLQKIKRKQNEKGTGIRSAVMGTVVPKSTLHDHLKKGRTLILGAPLKITIEEEVVLANDVLYLARNGMPVTPVMVKSVVRHYLRERRATWEKDNNTTALEQEKRRGFFKDDWPSKCWFHAFLSRHPTVKLRYEKTTSSAKASVTLQDLTEFYDNLLQVSAGVPQCNMLNGDETGVRFEGTKEKVCLWLWQICFFAVYTSRSITKHHECCSSL